MCRLMSHSPTSVIQEATMAYHAPRAVARLPRHWDQGAPHGYCLVSTRELIHDRWSTAVNVPHTHRIKQVLDDMMDHLRFDVTINWNRIVPSLTMFANPYRENWMSLEQWMLEFGVHYQPETIDIAAMLDVAQDIEDDPLVLPAAAEQADVDEALQRSLRTQEEEEEERRRASNVPQ